MRGIQISRRLVVGLGGTRLTPAERTWLSRYEPGGVILFAHNVSGPTQLVELCRELRSLLPPGAEIVADHEGGPISVLAAALGRPPAPWGLGRLDDPDLTRRVHRDTGRLLGAAGLHRVLAPCADVLVEPRNPVIGSRAFGADAATVARHVAAAVNGLLEGGVAVCLKHWPGHGGTDSDSHHGPAHTGRGDLAQPFAAGVAAGADSIMLGHLTLPCEADVGARPVTLEPAAVAQARSLAADSTAALGSAPGGGAALKLWSDDVTMGALRPAMAAEGIEVASRASHGLLEPVALPLAWFETLLRAGCDLLLCRGIPWTALPLQNGAVAAAGADEPAPDKPGRPEKPRRAVLPAQPGSYREARARLAGVGPLAGIPPDENEAPALWFDSTTGDSWGATAELEPLLRSIWPDLVIGTYGVTIYDDVSYETLLVTSHRPLDTADLQRALPTQRLPGQGRCVVMGHPSLAATLGEVLPADWTIQAVYDVRPDDLAPLL